MKRRLTIAAGIIIPLFLILCAMVTLLPLSLTGWFLLTPNQKATSPIVRIATVGPLPTIKPTATNAPLTAAELNAVIPTDPAMESSNTSQEVVQAPSLKELLGFDLPPGTVNSVTQEGIGSRVVIPKLNLDAPIILAPIENDTWQVDHLGQMVGHLEGTAPPGSESNLVLAGHVTLSKNVYGPFVGLSKLLPGDTIVVYEGDQAFRYVVENQHTVDRTAVEVTYPSERGEITLITCTNWSREENRYVNRIIVKGHLVK